MLAIPKLDTTTAISTNKCPGSKNNKLVSNKGLQLKQKLSILVFVLSSTKSMHCYLRDSNDHIQRSHPLPKPPSPAVIL